MSRDVARAVLASKQFFSGIRYLRRVNCCRQPTLRASGEIELLPVGYDEQAQVLTLDEIPFDEAMSKGCAVEIINGFFQEFCGSSIFLMGKAMA
jgi:hypothetical protein